METAMTPAIELTPEQRIAGLELLVQQLVFVMDAQGALDAEALDRWLTTAADRMRATASAPPPAIAALRRLQDLVQS